MTTQGKMQNVLDNLFNDMYKRIEDYDKLKMQLKQTAGNIKVYTGPKKGMFIINKHGKKVYIDRKTLHNNIPYIK
jgi:hypothetical protein